ITWTKRSCCLATPRASSPGSSKSCKARTKKRYQMKIDIFNHLFPQTFFDRYIEKGLPDIGKRVKAMPTIVKLDARFKVMDEFGDYCQVISLPAPTIEAFGGPKETPEIARIAND